MCLCSELQNLHTKDSDDDQVLLVHVEKILALVYEFVTRKRLTAQLPFTLKRRKSLSTNAEKRTAKIFTYDPNEYNINVLLKNNWKKWEEEPSSFWIQLHGHQSFKSDNPLHLIIFACLQLEQTDAHTRILRRFYTLVLYRLRDSQPMNEDAESIAQLFHDFLHPDQCGGQETLQALVDSVAGLIQAGSRYHNIAERLGLGSLFLLGEDIARTTWERWLPKEGELFEQAMDHLTAKGIVESGKAYEPLALKAIAHLVDHLPEPAWVVNGVPATQRPSKRSCPPSEPNAKRQRGAVLRKRDLTQDSCSETQKTPPSHNAKSPRDRSTTATTVDSLCASKDLSDPVETTGQFRTSQPLGWDHDFTYATTYTQGVCNNAVQQILPIVGQVLHRGSQEASSLGIGHLDGTEIVGEPEQADYPDCGVTNGTQLVRSDGSWNTLPNTDFHPLNWDQDWNQILGELGVGCIPLNWDQEFSNLDLTSSMPLEHSACLPSNETLWLGSEATYSNVHGESDSIEPDRNLDIHVE
ncbi:uncharacterized protein RAG0_17039 [Rhynchosporium agropyri]|uniref:Uncharacterized protein n=2 Tax=Rhynchosporium TaxID=38037 RepID=A0A1E1MW65_RHYSE|nr:uncharacterized protein RAG0_17039 [Rhynchosporium agropyri]CZT53331.1 uncharacterized protein RSE6_14825 [Rhynchosporium secalis]